MNLKNEGSIFTQEIEESIELKAEYRSAFCEGLLERYGVNGRLKVASDILEIESDDINDVIVIMDVSDGDTVDMGTFPNDETVYLPIESASSIDVSLSSGKTYNVTKKDSSYTITNGFETRILSVGESMELRD